MAKSYDLVIRGGRIIDGTGARARAADVAIRGDTIADVGELSPASETPLLEAAGLVVAPGFIDAWAAADPFAPAFPGAESKLLQGITTEVAGALGQCPFPVSDETGGSDDLTGSLGAPPCWSDARGYMLAVARAGSGIHRAFFAGYGQIRAAVIGPTNAPPTRDEARQIIRLVADALEAGCVGLAIDLSEPPAAFAGVDEIVEIARHIEESGSILAVTMRGGGYRLQESLNEILDVISRTGVDMIIPEFRIAPASNWARIDWVEQRLKEVAESGKNLTVVIEPYVAWTGPLAKLLPPEAREGGPYALAEKLLAGTIRGELIRFLEDRTARDEGYWSRVCPLGLSGDAQTPEDGRPSRLDQSTSKSRITIADIALARKRAPEDVYLDLISEKPGRNALYFEMNEGNRERELGWDFVTIGSGEAARPLDDTRVHAPVHPRARGATIRLIRRYVREKKHLTLEQAISRITSFPAERFRLGLRGKIESGYAADLVMFRADTISDLSTFSKPAEPPVGIDHVMVAGRFAVRNGSITGSRQGSVLRCSQSE